MYAFTLLSVALLASQAAASAIVTRNALAGLLRRQTGFDPSSIPEECQDSCNSVVNALNTCTDNSCLCSSSVNVGLYNCLECALTIAPDAGLMAESQSNLEDYEDACKQSGFGVASLTLTLPPNPTPTDPADASATFGSVTATETSDDADSSATAGSGGGVSDPLGSGGANRNNGAAATMLSSAAVVGAFGVVFAVLAL